MDGAGTHDKTHNGAEGPPGRYQTFHPIRTGPPKPVAGVNRCQFLSPQRRAVRPVKSSDVPCTEQFPHQNLFSGFLKTFGVTHSLTASGVFQISISAFLARGWRQRGTGSYQLTASIGFLVLC